MTQELPEDRYGKIAFSKLFPKKANKKLEKNSKS